MRHPFDGIILSNEKCTPATDVDSDGIVHSRNRRFFLQWIAGGLASAFALVFGSKAKAMQSDQAAAANRRGRVTTQAIGEEGGGVTTQAIGEEGGGRPRPPRPRPRPTTYAIGEEGAGSGFPPRPNRPRPR
jgi:hypothetical protein